jgi:hypothetical protein
VTVIVHKPDFVTLRLKEDGFHVTLQVPEAFPPLSLLHLQLFKPCSIVPSVAVPLVHRSTGLEFVMVCP